MIGYNLCVFLITAVVFSQLDSTVAIPCYSCNSTGTDAGNCLMSPSTQNSIDCETGCSTSISEDGTLIRGCQLTSCTSPSCWSCQTDNCNTNIVCKECLGLEDCATANVTDAKYNAVCPSSAGQQCVSQVNGNKTVSLLCGTACSSATCTSCATSLCNANLYPADRRQCYSCSGTDCNKFEESMITGCSQTDAKCFTTGTSETNMTRGCTSADTAIKCAADSTDPDCLICDTNLCNTLQYQRDAGSCLICDNCAAQQDANDKKSCDLALYNQTIGCYTVTTGTTVSRGCLNKLDGECSATNNCTSCSESGCNVAAVDVAFECIACISNEVADCWSATKPEELPVVKCDNGTCFSGIWRGLGVRDCFTSASQLMQYQCDHKVEGHQCTTCTTPTKCNKDPFNGAASLSQMGVVGLLMTLMLALRSSL
ncbi:keratin-associated protein 10-6 [Drosophila suzukii]|uniref:Keratin-associated protein 10-6 n=1 Tax=Drosophila suzukii TaxID=28584 RepID=A0AB39Z190_DROSZ